MNSARDMISAGMLKWRGLFTTMLCLVVLSAGLGCSGEQADSESASTTEPAVAGTVLYDPANMPGEVAGIMFYPDVSWENIGPSGMRAADYALPGVEGDTESASLAVFYFGPSSGGGVDANLQRWIGQMEIPTGENPIQSTRTINDMNAHLLEVHGTYLQTMGGPMSSQGEAKEDYSMYAAVLETEQGNVFFKLTGPKATAAVMNSQFQGMLENVQKSGIAQ